MHTLKGKITVRATCIETYIFPYVTSDPFKVSLINQL